MPDEKVQGEKSEARKVTGSMRKRALAFAQRAWRPAGTAVAVVLALLLTWHVVEGKHGLSVWRQKQVEDQQLRKEIEVLQRDNARLRRLVERLKTDPEAIKHQAREALRYVNPDEVIVTLPEQPQSDNQPAPEGKQSGSN